MKYLKKKTNLDNLVEIKALNNSINNDIKVPFIYIAKKNYRNLETPAK